MVMKKSFRTKTSKSTAVVPPESPNDVFRQEKANQIIECLEGNKDVDLWQLREFALTKGGLINGDIRRIAWHKLAGINRHEVSGASSFSSVSRASFSDSNGVHQDELDLIQRDVGRSVFFRYKRKEEADECSIETVVNMSTCVAHNSPPPLVESSVTSSVTSSTGDISSDDDLYRSTTTMKTTQSLVPTVTKSLKPSYAQETTSHSKDQLTSLIIQALSLKPDEDEESRLHYYQGFHDIASMVMINTNSQSGVHASENRQLLTVSSLVLRRIATNHLRDVCHRDFSFVIALLQLTFFPLLQAIDCEMHDFFVLCELEPTVILPWIITWFAHDVHDPECASRLFDAFLASHPLFPLYVSLAIIVKNRERIIEATEDECDGAMVHAVVGRLVKNISNDFAENEGQNGSVVTFQALVDLAVSFMRKTPPRTLLSLAKQYDQGQSQHNLKLAASISYFKLPPRWATASTVLSDWAQLKQKQKCLSRKGVTSPKKMFKTSSGLRDLSSSSSKNTKAETFESAKVAAGVLKFKNSEADVKKSGYKLSKSTPSVAAKSMMDLFDHIVASLTSTQRKKLITNGRQ